ncbi:MAG TPA: KamA family radical SAM protein [Candidatus Angelobacter sp.]|nr:KamA family radical SAM protein [Candidatus Angelobacter sp.]
MTNNNPKYLTRIDQITTISAAEKEELRPVTEKFVFRTNEYYQSLIDWNDPGDPIRRIVMPEVSELEGFGAWDASDEASYTVVRGLEHKYPDTALLLVNNVCGAYCRFCFRKRLFTNDNDEVTNDISQALPYLRAHQEINNVLLTGGDPLILSTGKLEKIIQQIRQIEHLKIIRIGSKIPAFNPYRIINDPSLLEMINKYSTAYKRIYIMAHFNHPRELTDVALQGIALLQKAGATVVNQSPMIRGVNDNPDTISTLFNFLSFNGVPPYYIFICRPTAGNRPFMVPIEEALEIFEQARCTLSGLAKHARLCMSHKTGKIEVVTKLGDQILFRYHRAPNPEDRGRVMIFDSNPEACWFDDYLQEAEESFDYAEAAVAADAV